MALLHELEKEDEGETLELHLRKLVKVGLLELPPKKLVGSGEGIYSGLWRGFEKRFQDQWWQNQPQPWICHLCKKEIDLHGTHNLARSIDHRVPWSVSKLRIATDVVCKDGIHWMVALTSDVRAVLQDEQNLEPSHQGCNSKKGGPTNTDSLAPMRIGKCRAHGKCSYPKAK